MPLYTCHSYERDGHDRAPRDTDHNVGSPTAISRRMVMASSVAHASRAARRSFSMSVGLQFDGGNFIPTRRPRATSALRIKRLLSASRDTASPSTEWNRTGGEDELRGLSQEEISRIGERTQEMWKEHVALTTTFPMASLPPAGGEAVASPENVRRKRLIYRSKQRGWLEVDLLLGTWAERNVPSLSVAEMNSYEDILNLETMDIFSFITGNSPPPAFVDTPMMKRLQEYVKSNPLGQSPESYASAKRESNLT